MKTQIRKPFNINQVEKLAMEVHPLQAAFDQNGVHYNFAILYAINRLKGDYGRFLSLFEKKNAQRKYVQKQRQGYGKHRN